jgi:hypothetical protein
MELSCPELSGTEVSHPETSAWIIPAEYSYPILRNTVCSLNPQGM